MNANHLKPMCQDCFSYLGMTRICIAVGWGVTELKKSGRPMEIPERGQRGKDQAVAHLRAPNVSKELDMA